MKLLSIALIFFWAPMAKAQSINLDSLKMILNKEQDPRLRFETIMKICEEYRFADPDSNLYYSGKAEVIAQSLQDPLLTKRAELYRGAYYYTTGKSDSALQLAEKNLQWLSNKKELTALTAQYSSFAGLCMMKLDRKKDAFEKFYTALQLAEQANDILTQAKANVNIGWVKMELNQSEEAIPHFHRALDLMKIHNILNRSYGTIYNNIASCYGAINKLDSAEKYSRLGIEYATKNEDPTSQANGHFILGTTFEKRGDLEKALSSFQKAQSIREKTGDPFYIVSDLSEISSLYAKLGRSEDGIKTSLKALEIAEKNNLSAKLPMIFSALANNYEVSGDYKNASIVYKRLNDLKDSLYNDANPKALAEMSAKYETEKKEQQIILQRTEISKKNLTIAGIIVLVTMGLLLGYSIYRRYQLKQEALIQARFMKQQEQATKAVLEAEERERQRIAKDLHDGVGQILSAAKMNLSSFESELNFSNTDQKNRYEKIITLVDESCKEVRLVSHNMMPNALLKAGLASAVREFTDKIDNKVIKINLHTEGLQERLDSDIETVLYRVIQECVNNVIKHARASHLDISIIKDEDGISATIEDNGQGFDVRDAHTFEGIGLKNIKTRLEYLKGTVEYDSKPGKGTLVAIHVPATKITGQNLAV